MKKYAIILFFIVSVNALALAQTKIQGDRLTQFNDAFESTLLPASGRVEIATALSKILAIHPKSKTATIDDMVGEFWIIDGMVVKLVTRSFSSHTQSIKFQDELDAARPSKNNYKGTVRDLTYYNDFFGEIKSVNGMEVLVYYYRTKSKLKYFRVKTTNPLYLISGTIYTLDNNLAHKLVDSIIKNIKLKPVN